MLDVQTAQTFADVIGLLRTSRRRGTAIYSYRQLADKLGFRSPRTLAMVHKGQRKPSRVLIERIISRFALDPVQGHFIFLLAENSRANGELNARIGRLREVMRKLSTVEIDETSLLKDSLTLSLEELSHFKQQLRLFIFDQRFRYDSSSATEKSERTIEIVFSEPEPPNK